MNLRFYVRCKVDGAWRRGVVFIRELVPRRAIAFVARTFYREPYSAYPMRHSIHQFDSKIEASYEWRRAGRWESLRAVGVGQSQPITNGSEEEFITEHYWGYTARAAGCDEYQVEHPIWRIWRCHEYGLDADVSTLYGERFVETLSTRPSSAFIADGSPIVVRCKSLMP